MFKKRIFTKIRYVTWSCPRCGKPFATEAERNLHWLACGSSRKPFFIH